MMLYSRVFNFIQIVMCVVNIDLPINSVCRLLNASACTLFCSHLLLWSVKALAINGDCIYSHVVLMDWTVAEVSQ